MQYKKESSHSILFLYKGLRYYENNGKVFFFL